MRDPVAELDLACQLLRVTDDTLPPRNGSRYPTAPIRADLQAIAGWLRRHPATCADIALNMPKETT